MSAVTERIGKQIREARKAKGLTQKELGEKLGVSESAVNRYENGKVNATIGALEKITNELGVTLELNIKN